MNSIECRAFVLDQLAKALSEPPGILADTDTVRTFIIAAWWCGPSELIDELDGIVTAITDPDWEFTGMIDLTHLFMNR